MKIKSLLLIAAIGALALEGYGAKTQEAPTKTALKATKEVAPRAAQQANKGARVRPGEESAPQATTEVQFSEKKGQLSSDTTSIAAPHAPGQGINSVEQFEQQYRENVLQSDDSTRRNYRRLLGVKFKKNVDYKDRVETFVDDDNYALLEKGASFVSFNLGVGSFKLDNKWIEPLVKIDDTHYTQMFVKASGGYFVANNTALALKLSYGFYDNRIKLNSDILQLLINSKTYETFNIGKDYAISAVVRNYVPIGFEQRFFIVTETALGYKYAESVQRNRYDEPTRNSRIKTHSNMAFLGVSPGVSYFMTKGFAFEFMLSPIQIYYKSSRSVSDKIPNGGSNNYGLSFAFTPFNIQLGMSYYFGLDYKKNQRYMSKYHNKVRR